MTSRVAVEEPLYLALSAYGKARSSEPVHLALLVSLILFACGSTLAQDVHYNFKPGTDFSKYHTYKWADLPGKAPPNELVQQDRQLAEKGLTKTDGDKADLYVGYRCAIDQEKNALTLLTGS